jgi:hypothetical protein
MYVVNLKVKYNRRCLDDDRAGIGKENQARDLARYTKRGEYKV